MSETNHSAFLTKAQVRTICNAASFSVQEFGAPMNVAFTMVGDKPVKTASSEFIHRLEQRLRYWAPNSCKRIPWICVHQRTVDAGFVANTIAYIPQAIIPRMTVWFERHRTKYREVAKFSVRLPINGQRPIKQHFDLLAICCVSADPSVWVRCAGESRRLLNIVASPTNGATTYLPVAGRRIEIAPCIGKSGQQSAVRDGMAMISAFDDREFSCLKTGWEEQEYYDRNIERTERKRAVAVLIQKWPEGLNALVDQKRAAAVLALKQHDPRSRLRSWRPWWLSRTENDVKSNNNASKILATRAHAGLHQLETEELFKLLPRTQVDTKG